MPQDSRALTRAARSRATATGETYTGARAAVVAIRELADEAGWTVDEATAFYDDPANKVLCDRCGWTVGMVCPECAPGCGCSVGCSGWRHHEYADDDQDGVDAEDCECGADHEYHCVCG